MGSSRASTAAGRRRASERSAPRKRAGGVPRPAAGTKKPAPPKSKAATVAKAGKSGAKLKRRSRQEATARSRTLTIAVAVTTVAVGLTAAYLLWFRDSSFVAVERVTVAGISGPEAEEVTAALSRAGQGMTTLRVDDEQLERAVSGYPTVVAVDAEADFPHALTIEVTGRPPVLAVSDGGPPVLVAADGTVLHGVDPGDAAVPSLQIESVPVRGKLTGEPLALAEVAGAAPGPLRPLIEDMAVEAGEGIEITLKGGIPVSFGDADLAGEKWMAVSAILADPQVETLTHLDVRVPERPSIGGAAPPSKGG